MREHLENEDMHSYEPASQALPGFLEGIPNIQLKRQVWDFLAMLSAIAKNNKLEMAKMSTNRRTDKMVSTRVNSKQGCMKNVLQKDM